MRPGSVGSRLRARTLALTGASSFSLAQDLHDIAQVMQEFYNIFGKELKSVTGDPQVRRAAPC